MINKGRPKLIAILGWLSVLTCSELAAFAIVPFVHQTITLHALSDTQFNYVLPNGGVATFTNEALSWISVSNADIDIWSFSTERFAEDFHFDDERFALGQDILLKTRNLIILQLSDAAFGKSGGDADLVRQAELTLSSRSLLGNALHTLQDYYSHSNWVEQHLLVPGTLELNPNLGTKGKDLNAPVNASCSDGSPGAGLHTSGDYLASGVADCVNICMARAGKCAHGNVLTTVELPFACPWNWALVELDCGINKDRAFRENHPQAFELARQHTSLFVAEIFNEALRYEGPTKPFVPLAICQFMGVPDPLATCVTSHTITVQKLNKNTGQPTLEGLVQSSTGNIIPTIDCALLCEGTSIAGSTVVLTAYDVGNWKFVRWASGGVCAASTSRTCNVTVDGNKLARAEFKEWIPPDGGALSTYDVTCWVRPSWVIFKDCDGPGDPNATTLNYFGETSHSEGDVGSQARVTVHVDRRLHNSVITVNVLANGTGSWAGEGHVEVSTSASDSILIVSDTLSPGTPVSVELNFSYQADVSQTETELVPPYGTYGLNFTARRSIAVQNTPNPIFSGEVRNEGPGSFFYPSDASVTVNSTVGSTIPLILTNYVVTNFRVDYADLQFSLESASYSPTIRETSGKDVQFESNSGYDYSQP